jgi:hypothetical protein
MTSKTNRARFGLFIAGLLAASSAFAAEVLNADLKAPAEGRHALTVQRSKHFGANAVESIILIDDVAAASIKGGDAVTVYVPDGRHIVGIRNGRRAETAADMSIAVDVSAGHEPILAASLANAGWSGFKLEQIH